MRYRILFSITLILTLMIFALLFFTFKIVRTYYANYDGEYVKSSTSNHYYRVTDIDFGDEFFKVFHAGTYNNSIHILYYNGNLNCLKLARSNSLNPKSPKDWEITTVVTSVTNSFKGLNQKPNLKNHESRSIHTVSYSMVAGKPCIAYSLIASKESEPCYLVVLQAKTANPLSADDWLFNCKRISNYKYVINAQSCYSNGQFAFLFTITNNGNQKYYETKYDELVLFTFNPKDYKWYSKSIFKRSPSENIFMSASLIPHPDLLLISYYQTDLDNVNLSVPFYLLAIKGGLSSDRSTWIKTRVISKDFMVKRGNRTIQLFYYDAKNSSVYGILQLINDSYLCLNFKFKNEKIADIKQFTYLGTPRSALNSYFQYSDLVPSANILFVNGKVIGSFVFDGVLQRRDYNIGFNPQNSSVNYINIFRKPLVEPSGRITPVATGNGLSFVYYQKKLKKLRFAREIEPKDVPVRRFKQLQNIFK